MSINFGLNPHISLIHSFTFPFFSPLSRALSADPTFQLSLAEIERERERETRARDEISRDSLEIVSRWRGKAREGFRLSIPAKHIL